RAIADDAGERDAARRALGAWADADAAGAALRAAIAEVQAAEEAARAAARAAQEAAGACADADRATADLVAGPVARLRAVAARVAARGGFDAPADDAAPADLVGAAVRLRGAALAAGDAHDAEAATAVARAEAALGTLAGAGAAVGVEDAAQVDGAVRRLAAARDAARARLAEVEGAAAEARRLLADAAAARSRARVHQQVANDLRANMFPRFLLNRFQERLAAGASIRLQELTGDAFRFAGAGADALAVVDMRRGERQRKASTLSGGERFLASLALALGLSDIAAESGGRLDCLFLDEGFSTLDADALEQALAGIERLAGDGRLVAVITHLPGVADRLGAAIHVEKDVAGVSRIRDGGGDGAVPSAAAAMMPA
ncbi:MAG: SbcC/MukB-like Walker B domain-containing protein, partial [Thermoleophilia bacterium]